MVRVIPRPSDTRSGDHTLIIAQATPRKWLANGKEIEVWQAPTYFGNVSFHIQSRSESGTITATVDLAQLGAPAVLLVRLRHPEGKTIRTVTLNGQSWQDFDVSKEWVRIKQPAERHYEISARY